MNKTVFRCRVCGDIIPSLMGHGYGPARDDTVRCARCHPAPVHVLPVHDTYPHMETAQCLCLPTIEEYGMLIIHHAWDGRE